MLQPVSSLIVTVTFYATCVIMIFLTVSEYIPGGELLALLEKCGKLPEELVKIFVAEIAIALGELFCFIINMGLLKDRHRE